MKEVRIDVVIPTYRPGKQFAGLLRALKKQTCPIRRILILNTEEDLFHEEYYRGIVPYEVRHIKKADFDHAATRRLGMDLCEGADYVLMMTQDAIPADEFLLERLCEAVQAHGPKGEPVAVSYARQLARRDCSPKERYMRNFSYPKESRVKTLADEKQLGIRTYFCSDVCALYDREVFYACGGYVSHADFNEDMLYAFRAMHCGYAVHYAATARVVHSHDHNCMEQFKRHYAMGVSQAEHPEVFRRVSSEKEGLALVAGTCRYLIRQGHAAQIPGMLVNQASRYAGYLCGKISVSIKD